MSRRKQRREQPEEDPQFVVDPFAALQKGDFPKGPKPAKPESLPAAPASPYGDLLYTALVIRIEKKGRRGKTVTVIDGLPLDTSEAVVLLVRDLRKYLATGGTVADTCIELQGDQRRRAAAWLRDAGFRVKGDCG